MTTRGRRGPTTGLEVIAARLIDLIAEAWVVEEKKTSFRPSQFNDSIYVFERDLKEARRRRRTGNHRGDWNDRDRRIKRR